VSVHFFDRQLVLRRRWTSCTGKCCRRSALPAPNAADDIDDEQEAPIEIEGEPLSETIIRERR